MATVLHKYNYGHTTELPPTTRRHPRGLICIQQMAPTDRIVDDPIQAVHKLVGTALERFWARFAIPKELGLPAQAAHLDDALALLGTPGQLFDVQNAHGKFDRLQGRLAFVGEHLASELVDVAKWSVSDRDTLPNDERLLAEFGRRTQRLVDQHPDLRTIVDPGQAPAVVLECLRPVLDAAALLPSDCTNAALALHLGDQKLALRNRLADKERLFVNELSPFYGGLNALRYLDQNAGKYLPEFTMLVNTCSPEAVVKTPALLLPILNGTPVASFDVVFFNPLWLTVGELASFATTLQSEVRCHVFGNLASVDSVAQANLFLSDGRNHRISTDGAGAASCYLGSAKHAGLALAPVAAVFADRLVLDASSPTGDLKCQWGPKRHLTGVEQCSTREFDEQLVRSLGEISGGNVLNSMPGGLLNAYSGYSLSNIPELQTGDVNRCISRREGQAMAELSRLVPSEPLDDAELRAIAQQVTDGVLKPYNEQPGFKGCISIASAVDRVATFRFKTNIKPAAKGYKLVRQYGS